MLQLSVERASGLDVRRKLPRITISKHEGKQYKCYKLPRNVVHFSAPGSGENYVVHVPRGSLRLRNVGGVTKNHKQELLVRPSEARSSTHVDRFLRPLSPKTSIYDYFLYIEERCCKQTRGPLGVSPLSGPRLSSGPCACT